MLKMRRNRPVSDHRYPNHARRKARAWLPRHITVESTATNSRGRTAGVAQIPQCLGELNRLYSILPTCRSLCSFQIA